MHRTVTSYSAEDAARFRTSLDRQRAFQLGGLVVVVCAAILALVARATGSELLGLPFLFWGLLAAALLIAKILFLLIWWRCPACRARLGPTYTPRFCSDCGLELRSPRRD